MLARLLAPWSGVSRQALLHEPRSNPRARQESVLNACARYTAVRRSETGVDFGPRFAFPEPSNLPSMTESEDIDVERPHTLTGDIRTHENFHSRYLDCDRTVLVYLPPEYDPATV